MNFERHPQFLYCKDVKLFQARRFNYYLSHQLYTTSYCELNFVRDYRRGIFSLDLDLVNKIEQFRNIDPDIIIVTAANKRLQGLQRLYKSILLQKVRIQIAWIIVENGSADGTKQEIADWVKQDSRIITLTYNHPFGYAAPARNRGLNFIQLACKYMTSKSRWVTIIDSDDYFENEFALKELSIHLNYKRTTLVHGYCICKKIDEPNCENIIGTIPRNYNSLFPSVAKLKDEFDLGPQILSSLVCCDFLPHFRYPNEFTMEDDALNRRIMAWSLNNKAKIKSVKVPYLVKTFHKNSLSTRNEKIGDKELKVMLGGNLIRGIRAQVVIGLLHVRDFFTKENI